MSDVHVEVSGTLYYGIDPISNGTHEGEDIDCEMPHSSKVWRGKTLPNVLLTANVSYFSESEIWLGKISVNGIQFAKFAIVFPTKILSYRVVIRQ